MNFTRIWIKKNNVWSFCQGAPKMYHPGAHQSVPPLNLRIHRFSYVQSGGSIHVKQVKDGTKRTSFHAFFTKLVYS